MSLSKSEALSLLGLQSGASAAEIKKAYRDLAKKHHPDLNEGNLESEALFKRNNEANDVLTKPDDDGISLDDLDFGEVNVGTDPFSDMFDAWSMLRGLGPHASFGSMLQIQVPVRMSMFFSGGSFDYSYQRITAISPGNMTLMPESVKITFEANTPVGSTLRFPGKGHQVRPNQAAGDLIIVLVPVSDGQWRVQGGNIACVKRLNALQAVLGTMTELQCPDSTTVRAAIRPGTKHGDIYRLNGKGLPLPGGKRGSLDLMIEIEIPILDERQERILRDAYEQMYPEDKA